MVHCHGRGRGFESRRPRHSFFREPESIQRNTLRCRRTHFRALFARRVGSSTSSLPFAVFPHVAVGVGTLGREDRVASGHCYHSDLTAFDFFERGSLLTTTQIDHDIFLVG